MDSKFLDELEEHITDAGTQEVWKKPIGDKILWLSPVTTSGQARVQAAMVANDPDANNIFEAKKVTLSRSIVGIDNIDLRPYRKSGEVFSVVDPRVGEKVSVDLPSYLLYKIADWGNEFVDVAFDVFADLMVSHKKSLLKEIQFENAKDPREELAELEDKAATLRESLGLPPKIEFNPEEINEEPEENPEENPQEEVTKPDFDPFKTIENPPEVPMEPLPPPVKTIPVPVLNAQSSSPRGQAVSRAAIAAAKESSPDFPFQAIPSVPQEIIESKSPPKQNMEVPKINPVQQNINPRFQRPQGR